MANLRRGEIEATLGGQRHVLCLTLGALAELEQRFGERDLVGIAKRFEGASLSSRDLLAIISCGLKGGGATLSDDEIASLQSDNGLAGYLNIAARLLVATFGMNGATEDGHFPPKPQDA